MNSVKSWNKTLPKPSYNITASSQHSIKFR